MADGSGNKTLSPWVRWIMQRGAWLLVGLTVLLVVVVRVRLRDMPLERDEGEYAYAGQLILQGVPPYQQAYNMKLPGTYAAYALIMAVFGQSPAGIHLGVLLVNIASILLVFLIGRRLLDDAAGAAAAVSFALMSLSPTVLGLAGHATHFVVLLALGGTLLLLKAGCGMRGEGGLKSKIRNPNPNAAPDSIPPPATCNLRLRLFSAGFLFGLAFLMKQHGIFFGLFGGLYLLWLPISRWLDEHDEKKRRWPRFPLSALNSQLLFAAGLALPYLLTCLILWCAGVFHQFFFWTYSYAAKYATAIPAEYGAEVLKNSLSGVVGPNLPLWLLPWAGALWMWWEERLTGGQSSSRVPRPSTRNSQPLCPRFFLTTLLLCSLASASVGFYFREHYFILILPALALLSGIAVSRALHLLHHDRTIELFLAVTILLLFVVGIPAALIGNGSFWFVVSPTEAVRNTYGTTLFGEAQKVAEYIKSNTSRDARIAVLGSEPEIYFYSRRRSATGFLYTYPLVEAQPFARQMQEEMIGEIERARPEYVVYVGDVLSWMTQEKADRKVFDWWEGYWATNLDLVATMSVEGETEEKIYRWLGKSETEARTPSSLLILKRKAAN